jgi:hypothetical protein
MWHINVTGNSESAEFWNSFYHLKNILSYVTLDCTQTLGRQTSFRHCLVNTCKYTLRWTPLFGIMSSVFHYSQTCTATAKSIHKIHVTIFNVGKHKRHGHSTSQLNETVTNAECEVAAAIYLAWLSTQGWICGVQRYRMMLNEYITWNSKETTFFSSHYLRYHSNLDRGVFGYFKVL